MSSGQGFIKQLIENFTGFLTIISSDHNYIHQGIGFSVVYQVSALGAGAKVYLGITTPSGASGKYIHFRPTGFSSTDSGVVGKIYENLSYTGGSSVTPFNRNRVSTTTSSSTVATGVTATPGAQLVVAAASVGSGGNPTSSAGGGGSSENNELIFKAATPYVIEIENIGAAATNVVLTLFWYEESNGA